MGQNDVLRGVFLILGIEKKKSHDLKPGNTGLRAVGKFLLSRNVVFENAYDKLHCCDDKIFCMMLNEFNSSLIILTVKCCSEHTRTWILATFSSVLAVAGLLLRGSS